MVKVIGLGPGHADYILPLALKEIKAASVVIGAKRHIDSIEQFCRSTMVYQGNLSEIASYLRDYSDESIAVVVSGDTGFHSLLKFVKRHVDHTKIKSIPGISSLQYLYSTLSMDYENSHWISLHGQETDFVSIVNKYKSLGILTDKLNTPSVIANKLKDNQLTHITLYVGERLSYETEKISRLTVDEAVDFEADSLSVVILDNEMDI